MEQRADPAGKRRTLAVRVQGMTPEESFAEFYAARRDPCLRALVAGGTDRPAAEEAVAEGSDSEPERAFARLILAA